MIVLDGSEGEGGGQILRSALTLSLITGQPIRVERIRAKRQKPGLLRQHLTAVRAATAVGRADVDGARIGSLALTFKPNTISPGFHKFAVGSAGSAMLVLQTVLPALLTAPGSSVVEVDGGTHNPASPPFDFLERTFLPVLARMGARVRAELDRPGFYPAGGGRVRLIIEPTTKLLPIELVERGPITERRIVARVAGVPEHVADREIVELLQRLNWPSACASKEVLDPTWGPGNVLLAELTTPFVTEVASGFGERGLRAEVVAERVAAEVNTYLEHGAPVGENLADQLLLPLALAGEGRFLTGPLSLHARTQIQTIQRLLDVPIHTEDREHGATMITIGRKA